MSLFQISNKYLPAGDQPNAIKGLVDGVHKGLMHQVLLGATGTGKTFTGANVINQIEKPTLVIAHNKTLAAQLAQEYGEFFPNNAVHYFVSYYDYYQPEAYIAHSDTFIEKEAQINEEIERLRHASTQALLSRRDTIIVASVSCIYGLGSPEQYEKVHLKLAVGQKSDRAELIRKAVNIFFERTNADLSPGQFRAMGNSIEIMPINERVVFRINFGADTEGKSEIKEILKLDEITRSLIKSVDAFFLFPAKHFITPENERERAIRDIKHELDDQLKVFASEGKILESDRIKRRTTYDLAMIKEIGYCNGIENYSRHFSGKAPGEAPDTLLSYFPHKADGSPDFLTIIDESHVTVPQIGGMYAGDASRKNNLVDFGFRLPSAKDNRPLKFDEFEKSVGQVIYTSATPGKYEIKESQNTVEQVIRPTGLIDPEIVIKPIVSSGDKEDPNSYRGQVFDIIDEAEKTIKRGWRVIITTLTKKMAEDLSEYLKEKKIKSEYLHSDIETLDRIRIITDFRKGVYDIVVGVNLLREGLDLPEVALIGILDADKEGFLRSETALIQTIGRAARNVEGKVILYADEMTGSMERAIAETTRRRNIQIAYNTEHGITPKTIIKNIKDITEQIQSEHAKTVKAMMKTDAAMFEASPEKLIKQKEKEMSAAVKDLDFETAAILRDQIKEMMDKAGLSEKSIKAAKKKARKEAGMEEK